MAPGAATPGLPMLVQYRGIQALHRMAHPRWVSEHKMSEVQTARCDFKAQKTWCDFKLQTARCDFKPCGVQVAGTQSYQRMVRNKYIDDPVHSSRSSFPVRSPPESSAVSGMCSALKAMIHVCPWCQGLSQQSPVLFFWEMCTFSRESWAELRLGPSLVFLCLFIKSLIKFPNPALKGRQLFLAQKLRLIKTTSIKHPNPGREYKVFAF